MKNKASKLSLDQFKTKIGDLTDSLDLISGDILGTCHDEPSGGSSGGGSGQQTNTACY